MKLVTILCCGAALALCLNAATGANIEVSLREGVPDPAIIAANAGDTVEWTLA